MPDGSSLTSTDRTMLAKLCRMFSSDSDGEVLNAARAAHRLVRASGLSWDHVLSPMPGTAVSTAGAEPRWRRLARRCLLFPDALFEGEAKFLDSLVNSKWTELTDKQEAWLSKIEKRVAKFVADRALHGDRDE